MTLMSECQSDDNLEYRVSPFLESIIAVSPLLSNEAQGTSLEYLDAFLDTKVSPYGHTYREAGQPLAGLALREELYEMRINKSLLKLAMAQLAKQ